MLSLTRLTNGGKRGGNVVAYLQATEYYRDKDGAVQSSSAWVGKGAADLGLSGEPTAEQMERLAAGFEPSSPKRKPLTPNAGKNDRVIGIDATFSPPKTVSVAYALAKGKDRDAILKAQQDAVGAVLEFIEKEGLLRARRGHAGIDSIGTEGVVASTHNHFANRNLEPQLHTHTLLYNVARGEDGKLCCVETKEIFRYTQALSALYRSQLAANLHELGYGIEHTLGRDGLGEENGRDAFEIAGVPKELRDHFSTRAQEVAEYKKVHPHAHNAAVATRKHKDEPSFSELTKAWDETLADLQSKHPEWVPTIEGLKAQKSVSRERDTHKVIEQLHEMEAVITRPALLERLAKNSVGKGIAHVLDEEDAFAARADIVHIKPERQAGDSQNWSRRPDLKHRETRYANLETIAREEAVIAMADRAAKDMRHQVSMKRVTAGIARFEAKKSSELGAPFKLKDEQRKMVEHCANGTGAIACVVGFAGTGKTTASSALVEVMHADGMKVRGAATSWKAAKKLQSESGVEGIALAALAKRIEKKNPDWMPNEKSVLILDEASMVGTRSFDVVQKAYLKAGGKIICMGDNVQIQAIDQGSFFRALTERFGFSRLTEITRQKTAEGLDLSNHFYEGSHQKRGERTGRQAQEHGRALYKKMDDMGSLHQFEDGKAAIDGLVKAFLASPRQSSDKLAIAATNVDVQEIAKGIRKGLKELGELEGDDYNATVVTAAGGQQRLPVAVHDRIRFFAKVGDHSGDKAATNEDAIILHIEQNGFGGLNIKVRMDELAENGKPRTFVFDTYEHDNWGYSYATTAHKSQGQTTDECFWLGSAASNHHLGLVAATRAKHRLNVFIDQETASGFASTLGRHSFKANALEEGVQQNAGWSAQLSSHLSQLKIKTSELVGRIFGPEPMQTLHPKNQKPKNLQQRGRTL